jgi:hypothetical protein
MVTKIMAATTIPTQIAIPSSILVRTVRHCVAELGPGEDYDWIQ